MNDFTFSSNLKSLCSVIVINILIIYFKFKKKKIIFFYHPRKLLTFIHTFYIEDLFNDLDKNIILIYGHTSHGKINGNYFFISYFSFIF